jgi:hypothetical protein
VASGLAAAGGFGIARMIGEHPGARR